MKDVLISVLLDVTKAVRKINKERERKKMMLACLVHTRVMQEDKLINRFTRYTPKHLQKTKKDLKKCLVIQYKLIREYRQLERTSCGSCGHTTFHILR